MTTTVTATNAYDIYVEAAAAAEAAAKACVPTPMIVGNPTTPFGNEIDYSQKTYYVPGGVCGNAYVTIRPARGAFVTMLKKRGVGYRNSYAGGYDVAAWQFAGSIRGNQSYEVAKAAAKAAAGVLNKYGITAYVNAYLD